MITMKSKEYFALAINSKCVEQKTLGLVVSAISLLSTRSFKGDETSGMAVYELCLKTMLSGYPLKPESIELLDRAGLLDANNEIPTKNNILSIIKERMTCDLDGNIQIHDVTIPECDTAGIANDGQIVWFTNWFNKVTTINDKGTGCPKNTLHTPMAIQRKLIWF